MVFFLSPRESLGGKGLWICCALAALRKPSPRQNGTVDMALTHPSAILKSQHLPLASVEGTLYRISHRKFADPLYWSCRGLYRFDSPLAKYGVLNTDRTFETALLEVFGDHWLPSRTTARDFLKEFDEIRLERRLKVVNLSGKQLNPLGTDANIFAPWLTRLPKDGLHFFMEHPDAPHGIRYPSRKNQRLHNFALFNTPAAIAAVTVTTVPALR
jgi:hypothetical protein